MRRAARVPRSGKLAARAIAAFVVVMGILLGALFSGRQVTVDEVAEAAREQLDLPAPRQHGERADRETLARAPIATKTRARITWVFDGDSFQARTLKPDGTDGDMLEVRVKGIDCPESAEGEKCLRDEKRGGMSCADQIPLGKKAKRLAIKALKDQTVTLESESGTGNLERDRYHRALAYVRLAAPLAPPAEILPARDTRTSKSSPAPTSAPGTSTHGIDRTDYGLAMVADGLCFENSDRYPHARSALYRSASRPLSPNTPSTNRPSANRATKTAR